MPYYRYVYDVTHKGKSQPFPGGRAVLDFFHEIGIGLTRTRLDFGVRVHGQLVIESKDGDYTVTRREVTPVKKRRHISQRTRRSLIRSGELKIA